MKKISVIIICLLVLACNNSSNEENSIETMKNKILANPNITFQFFEKSKLDSTLEYFDNVRQVNDFEKILKCNEQLVSSLQESQEAFKSDDELLATLAWYSFSNKEDFKSIYIPEYYKRMESFLQKCSVNSLKDSEYFEHWVYIYIKYNSLVNSRYIWWLPKNYHPSNVLTPHLENIDFKSFIEESNYMMKINMRYMYDFDGIAKLYDVNFLPNEINSSDSILVGLLKESIVNKDIVVYCKFD